MEKEKMEKRTGVEKILGKTKKIRKSQKTGNFDSKTNYYGKYGRVPEVTDSSLDFLVEGLTHVDLGGDIEPMQTLPRLINEDYRESPSTSRDSFSPIERAMNIPKLPVAMRSNDPVQNDDVSSDAESDFSPDWSSSVSNVSSAVISEEDDLPNDVMTEGGRGSSPELELQFSEESIATFCDVTNLPIPAAGNEQERSQSSQTSSSDGKSSPVAQFKPQAIRRVKSMVFDVGKESEIDAELRAKMLMRNQFRDVTPSKLSISPSPLLSAEYAESLKRTPSQLNVKYTLKRSRSHFTIPESSMKRHVFDADVINEESDDDISEVDTEHENMIKMSRKDLENVFLDKDSS